MADKPITFSAPMVRALLAGTKTQTRRLCAWANNPNSPALTHIVACDEPGWFGDEEGEVQFKVPYATGDRLYVREHWSSHAAFDGVPPRDLKRGSMIYTRSDYTWHNNGDWIGAPYGKHRQAMHMPRWASRLWLAVTDVRVQRLQDISEADCVAEGIEHVTTTASGKFYRNFQNPVCPVMAYGAYRSLWDHINGDGAWEANPWIVAVTFDVNHGNIDAEAANNG